MSNELRIQEICNSCNGTGIDDRIHDGEGNPAPETCGFCGGDGWVQSDKIDISDIMNKFDDVLQKCNDILEKLNE